MKPKIKHPKHVPSAYAELRGLSELVGEFIEYWGFKAVHGRMWCYLYLSRTPLSSRQLAQLLSISPALVTQSIQILLEYRVILEVEKGANGVLRFQANPDVADAVRGVLSLRESVLLQRLEKACQALRGTHEKARAVPFAFDPAREDQVRQWVKLAQLALSFWISTLAVPGNPFEKPESFRDLFGS